MLRPIAHSSVFVPLVLCFHSTSSAATMVRMHVPASNGCWIRSDEENQGTRDRKVERDEKDRKREGCRSVGRKR
jgi:hypothetical protein